MAEVILVTGGARSGKSKEALRRAENFGRRVFIATAEITDEEMRRRIERHQKERSPDWETVEAPRNLAEAISQITDPEAVVVVDCLTVWLGNLMHYDNAITEDSRPCLDLLEALRTSGAARVILVTNEVGMGIVPENELSRRFRDVAGRLNQRVAEIADSVILSVCGLTLQIK